MRANGWTFACVAIAMLFLAVMLEMLLDAGVWQ